VTVQFDPAITVSIPDTNLRTVLETLLNKNAGEAIMSYELTGLTTLRANNAGISNLTGLEHATRLTQLFLGRNSISDISALSGLTNLTSVNLSVNSVSDLTPLSGLTNLERLQVREMGISDIAFLVANTGLGSGDNIDLLGNSLNVAAYTTHIPALQGRGVTVRFSPAPRVSICDRTAAVEAAILAAIPGNVACGQVTTVQLAGITTLNLNRQSLTALQSGDFASLINLDELLLGSNDLASLPADVFNGLSKLRSLWLNDNELTGLPANVFNGLTNLHILYLNNNNELTSLPANVFNGPQRSRVGV